MDNLTFAELFKQVSRLYKDEEYAQALDLVTREFPHLPQEAHHLYFWQACLACRTNQTERALDLLAEAVEAGYWYNEMQLRQDADLAPLQGRPTFEGLVEICLERQAAAQTAAAPRLIVREPAASLPAHGPPWPWLLALHGNNSREEVAAEHWSAATRLGCLVALPGSSQVTGPDTYSWNDWEWGRDELQSHAAALRENYRIDEERLVLGGFSMGGGLALWLALTGAIQARGFILVGAYVPDMQQLISLIERSEAQGLRGYLIVGEQDEDCYQISPTLAEHLRAHSVPCQMEVHPELGHEFPPHFENSLARALEYILPD